MTNKWTIYYDDEQEGDWFEQLDVRLKEASMLPLKEALKIPDLASVLRYDRPDILLTHDGVPVLVVERTIEVPSGHNVGQRFARLAAAAERQVPVVYFGPFKARKHGGKTAGPRYMNLRLFYALDKLESLNSAAVSTVNWPVDEDCELLRTPEKDEQMRAYLCALLDIVLEEGSNQQDIVERIRETSIYKQLHEERIAFEKDGVRRPEQYQVPPESLQILSASQAVTRLGFSPTAETRQVYSYVIGSRSIRSDPYTGMGMLYRNLYILPNTDRRSLVLEFPHISLSMWTAAASSGRPRKDIKLYRHIADGVRFSDGFRMRGSF